MGHIVLDHLIMHLLGCLGHVGYRHERHGPHVEGRVPQDSSIHEMIHALLSRTMVGPGPLGNAIVLLLLLLFPPRGLPPSPGGIG